VYEAHVRPFDALPVGFRVRVRRDAGDAGCWLWVGPIANSYAASRGKAYAYGAYNHHNRKSYAHRYAYECLVGPIPAGYVLDHVCRERLCVNPAHLEAVTVEENARRGNRPRSATNGVRPVGDVEPWRAYVEQTLFD
jgi:hypothetical protein